MKEIKKSGQIIGFHFQCSPLGYTGRMYVRFTDGICLMGLNEEDMANPNRIGQLIKTYNLGISMNELLISISDMKHEIYMQFAMWHHGVRMYIEMLIALGRQNKEVIGNILDKIMPDCAGKDEEIVCTGVSPAGYFKMKQLSCETETPYFHDMMKTLKKGAVLLKPNVVVQYECKSNCKTPIGSKESLGLYLAIGERYQKKVSTGFGLDVKHMPDNMRWNENTIIALSDGDINQMAILCRLRDIWRFKKLTEFEIFATTISNIPYNRTVIDDIKDLLCIVYDKNESENEYYIGIKNLLDAMAEMDVFEKKWRDELFKVAEYFKREDETDGK